MSNDKCPLCGNVGGHSRNCQVPTYGKISSNNNPDKLKEEAELKRKKYNNYKDDRKENKNG